MAETALETHRFRVHARHVDHHHARVVEESSFEAAAVAYLEDFLTVGGESDAISVIVRNLDDGHEHCFTVDLETGETAPCG
jgi:hypothetical protein